MSILNSYILSDIEKSRIINTLGKLNLPLNELNIAYLLYTFGNYYRKLCKGLILEALNCDSFCYEIPMTNQQKSIVRSLVKANPNIDKYSVYGSINLTPEQWNLLKFNKAFKNTVNCFDGYSRIDRYGNSAR